MSTPDRNDDRTPADRPDEREDKPATPGSGKQFSQEVHSPEETPGQKGSGKQFSPSDKQRDDDPDDVDQRGSGKQFSPDNRDT